MFICMQSQVLVFKRQCGTLQFRSAILFCISSFAASAVLMFGFPRIIASLKRVQYQLNSDYFFFLKASKRQVASHPEASSSQLMSKTKNFVSELFSITKDSLTMN